MKTNEIHSPSKAHTKKHDLLLICAENIAGGENLQISAAFERNKIKEKKKHKSQIIGMGRVS